MSFGKNGCRAGCLGIEMTFGFGSQRGTRALETRRNSHWYVRANASQYINAGRLCSRRWNDPNPFSFAKVLKKIE